MQQLDPKATWLFFFSFVLRWIIVILYIIFLSTAVFGRFIFGSSAVPIFNFVIFILLFAVPAFLILCFIWAKLSYKYYRYEIAENGFRKESGVIYKRYVTIPYDRIQNVDIYRGILARLLGLSDLQIQTAGYSANVTRYGITGAGAEGRLPGLSLEVAEQVRDEVVKLSRQSKNQGL